MTADNPTPQPTNTKARFDAEKIEAGYKYLDSLRELMGVGEPVGEGGVPERTIDRLHRETGTPMWALELAFDLAERGMLDEETMAGTAVILHAAQVIAERVRATQPATAPGDYIAWCRYVNHGQDDDGADILTFEACSSDDKGAFRVYAAPVATPTDVAERARRAARAYLATKSHIVTSDPTSWQGEESRLADIIAAECGGSGGGGGGRS
jgi:hypothetical protein